MIYILTIILVIIAFMLLRTFLINKKEKISLDYIKPDLSYYENAPNLLSKAIRHKTISKTVYEETDFESFHNFISFIKKQYKEFISIVELELVNDYSIVIKWKGEDSKKKPILLMGHYDVVPANNDWTYDPFSGEIKDGYVWGRGSLDVKVQIISCLESASKLASENFTPERDIYFSFGHDEEQGGKNGALKVFDYFKQKNIHFDSVIDEGGCITRDFMKGIDRPIAVIGTCEKGYANIQIEVSGDEGHSSNPPKMTSLGKLSKLICDLEKNQMSMKLSKPTREMLYRLRPYMSFANKLILSNLWLFKYIFMFSFSKMPIGNALLRTTTAVTMAEGSSVPNVLPKTSKTIINFRISPEDSCSTLMKHIIKVTKKYNAKITPLRLDEPSKFSSFDSKCFLAIEKTVRKISKDAITTPYLMMAGTDSIKFEDISDNIYRFSPYEVSKDLLKGIHGTDEKIPVEQVKLCAYYFEMFIKDLNW